MKDNAGASDPDPDPDPDDAIGNAPGGGAGSEDLGRKWNRQFPRTAWLVLAVILFGIGIMLGRSTAVPLSTDFWRIAAQPTAVVLAGFAALTAAAVAFRAQRAASLTALHGVTMQIKSGSAQYEKTYRADVEQRRAAARDTSVDRCWERFKWIVALGDDTEREDDPFDVVTAMLAGLYDDALALNDQTLTAGIVQYNEVVLKVYNDRLNG